MFNCNYPVLTECKIVRLSCTKQKKKYHPSKIKKRFIFDTNQADASVHSFETLKYSFNEVFKVVSSALLHRRRSQSGKAIKQLHTYYKQCFVILRILTNSHFTSYRN